MWLIFAVLDPFSSALAIVLAPFVVPFYSTKSGHLPFGFRWMETYDNPIDGDSGHVLRWEKIRSWGWIGVYLQRVAWLWRNKAYNFAYNVLGRDVVGITQYKGRVDVSDTYNRPGYVLMWNDNAWGLFVYTPSFKLFGIQFYWRIYIGWKLKDVIPEANANVKKRVMLAFFISPFRK